jgi:hypothetical protein
MRFSETGADIPQSKHIRQTETPENHQKLVVKIGNIKTDSSSGIVR